MILGGCPDHGRATDIDIFYRIIKRRIFAADGLFEGIKINSKQVDRFDIVFLHDVFVRPASAQKSPVNDGVQRFDTAVHDFGKTGPGRYFDRIDARVLELSASTTG